ncbi:hypothetical protein F4781DRAFT_438442 [Annulohypoxylon bovei var. microspora]|nr:hypothetical protein F4781DRAFT_438442 [Annulohypoxylon bovei var. microspora]
MLDREVKGVPVPVELRRWIVSLYTAILSYLMTIVCSHINNLTFRTPSNIFYSQSRRMGLKTIAHAENVLPVYSEDRVQQPLETLLRAISMKTRESDGDVEQPGLSSENVQLLNSLGIPDPRLSIPSVRDEPSHQLYQALLSTEEYTSFREWDTTTELGNRLLWVRGERGQALKTIIWLILVYQPDLSTHLSEKIKSTGRQHFNNLNDFLALSAVFYNMVEDERLSKTCIVVDSLDESIRLYKTEKVADLAKTKKYDEALEEEVAEELYLASQGNYLWGSLYDHLFGTFDRLPRRDKEFCTAVLSTMALVHDTLYIDELDALAHLGKRVDLMNILKKCSPFLLVDDRRVSFVHQSAKAYIQQVLKSTKLPQPYSELTQNCIEYVGKALGKNKRPVKPRLEGGGVSTEDDAYCYSTLNWITHLSEIQDITNEDEVRIKVYWFLENFFMDWVEDLVLRKQLPVAAAKLQDLDLSLQKRTPQEPSTEGSLAAAIRDA